MPGPPPPPPPGGPPPPPMASPAFNVAKSSPNDRGALLQSIRKGKPLKKTVTVDKSGPMIPGKTSSVSSSSQGTSNGRTSNATSSNPMPNGMALGGLFAGGMPKLRSTGILGVQSQTNSVDNSINQNSKASDTVTNNMRNLIIQNAVKKQLATDNKNRGPPPPAPVRFTANTGEDKQEPNNAMRNGHSSSTSSLLIANNSSFIHKKAHSNLNLSVDSVDATPNNNCRPTVASHGKPNLAPKPPAVNGKPMAPPKKLMINGKPVRTQSMRSPRSPSPQSPDKNAANYPGKFDTVRNMSSMYNQSLQNVGSISSPSSRPRPPLNGRPSAPPPSIPQQQPPPPPSQTSSLFPSSTSLAAASHGKMVKPGHAPPPPPPHAPPPPPSRTAPSQPSRAPPAIPANAPPPPPRHSSIGENSTKKTSAAVIVDLEAKFASMFHRVQEFPRPMLYKNVTKTYSSKQVVNKQQAPLPPNHVQLSNKLWDSSTC